MNMRIAVVCLMLVPSLALAQEPQKTGKAAVTEHTAILETMQRGKDIRGDRESYQHLPELRAVERTGSDETPQQTVQRFGAGGSQVVETKGRLVLFRVPQGKPALLEGSGDSALYPVVLNMRTKNLGVLTGMQVVKPKNMADAAAIASSYGLETVKEFPQLRTVFYRAKTTIDIADVVAGLQADPRVENAYPEIMEHIHFSLKGKISHLLDLLFKLGKGFFKVKKNRFPIGRRHGKGKI